MEADPREAEESYPSEIKGDTDRPHMHSVNDQKVLKIYIHICSCWQNKPSYLIPDLRGTCWVRHRFCLPGHWDTLREKHLKKKFLVPFHELLITECYSLGVGGSDSGPILTVAGFSNAKFILYQSLWSDLFLLPLMHSHTLLAPATIMFPSVVPIVFHRRA